MGRLSKAVVILVLVTGMTGCTQVVQTFQNPAAQQGAGSNYEAYLAGNKQLVVELDHSPGAKWDTSENAPEAFERQLERITAKDVQVRTNNELPDKGKDYVWSTSELRDLHAKHQDLFSDRNKVVMHALFVDGHHERDSTIGLAYDADAFALFTGKIDKNTCSNGALVCDRAERYEVMRAVSIHEAGHLFGLVNAPLPMQTPHEDADHKAHSSNEDSVMYWKIETGAITDLFSRDTIPYKFDSNDMADAKAQRSGSA